ncbi:nitroreductase family protein [Candidatus Omnitrophota bacterium]
MLSEKNKAMTSSIIEAINNRRSIRSYEAKPIPKDIIKTIIKAGNQAPFMSEKHEKPEDIVQPWRFVVVEDPEFKKKLVQTTEPIRSKFVEGMKKTMPEMYEQAMRLYEAMNEPKDMIYYFAPVIIFVVGPNGSDVSCALACENIMIAATSFGLGSCYVGFGAMVTGDADIKQVLELRDDERIFGPVVLGYPKSDSSALDIIRPNKKEPIIKWI